MNDRPGMKSRWTDADREALTGPVGECVYCTRLIGADPSLVLHGGGNSSVKAPRLDITGRSIDALHVKGSGWDMATIEAPGFTALPLDRLRELVELDALSDPDMMRELSAARLDPAAPSPSVETLLHALLPHRAVQHSHADVIVNLTNLADGEAVVREVYGDDVVIVPYVMPGLRPGPSGARAVAAGRPRRHRRHGAAQPRAVHLRRHVGRGLPAPRRAHHRAPRRGSTPTRRRPRRRPPRAVAPADVPVAHRSGRSPASPVGGRRRSDDRATPRRSRRSRDFVGRRRRRFAGHPGSAHARPRHPHQAGADGRARPRRLRGRLPPATSRPTGTGPAPRSPTSIRHRASCSTPNGVCSPPAAPSADAVIAADIYHHTIPVLERAEDHLGGYVALPAADLFDMEYWELEQAKLARRCRTPAVRRADRAGHRRGVGHRSGLRGRAAGPRCVRRRDRPLDRGGRHLLGAPPGSVWPST